jgi:FkbM family methyltransferase
MSVVIAVRLGEPVVYPGADLSGDHPLSVSTPAASWAYGVSWPVEWRDDTWVLQHDGLIRLRLRVLEGAASALAVDATGSLVIDEAHVVATSEPVDIELVSSPLGACQRIVIRNGPSAEAGARVVVESIDCEDLGPAKAGEDLAAPEPLTLRAVEDWPRYYGRSGLTVAERRRAARYLQLTRVQRMPWIEQLQVNIAPNDDLSRALYISGLYEPQTMLVLRRLLPPGAVFVDVGANAGLFSMVASRWVGTHGRVYAFEPSEREYARLLEHLRLNDLQNVSARRLAVGSHEGSAQLRVAPFPHAGHNTLGASFAYPDVQTERIETVHTVTLDAFVRDEGIAHVDAIKMDIEGSELAALLGAAEVIERFRPILIIELSRAALGRSGATPELVVQKLSGFGYRICRIGAAAELVPLAVNELGSDQDAVAIPAEKDVR